MKHKQQPINKPHWAWLWRRPACLLGFGLGSGLSPIAPGTAGTLAAYAPALLWWQTGYTMYWLAIAACVLFPLGVWICQRCEYALGVSDYGGVVIDEILAMWLILGLIPQTPFAWLAAFFAFRLFDIVKPFPIAYLDRRIPGGLGVMVDDYVAAVMALAVLWLGFWWIG